LEPITLALELETPYGTAGAKPQFIGVNYLEMGINHAPSAEGLCIEESPIMLTSSFLKDSPCRRIVTATAFSALAERAQKSAALLPRSQL